MERIGEKLKQIKKYKPKIDPVFERNYIAEQRRRNNYVSRKE